MEIINVWHKPSHYPLAIQFWKDLSALPAGISPIERAKELVFIAFKDDRIIGVTTAEQKRIVHLNKNKLFSYRILLHPDFRVPGLSAKMTVLTRDFLENLFLEGKTECIGLVAIAENKRHIERRREAVWKASQFMFAGTLRDGRPLRIYYFKGALI